MTKGLLLALVVSFGLVGCAGLRQFPEVTKDHENTLKTLDKDYADAVDAIYGTKEAPKQSIDAAQAKAVRNRMIETRMAVIDVYFKEFQSDLVKENVRAEFLIALIGVGVGGAGALVSETASQILSAVSGGLAGGQAAYSKAVLYDKAMSALVAQMQASRKVIKVQIFERWAQDIDKYPMWMARTDLEAYYFAGSVPGAIISTAADAKVKDAEADAKLRIVLRAITPFAVLPETLAKGESLEGDIDRLSADNAKAALERVRSEFQEREPDLGKLLAQYTPKVREGDQDGAKAKTLLKRLVLFTLKTPDDVRAWEKILAP